MALAQTAPGRGASVARFIESLRGQGITVVFSSDLVPDSMLVETVPEAGTPLGQLRQVLAVHDLALRPGPRGTWLVVRAVSEESSKDSRRESTPGVERPGPPLSETIVVSASRYAFTRSTTTSASNIDRLQLEHAPVLGDDALRTIHSVPGMTSSGLTARSNVRGGVADESLLLLDGVRLYSPYHLKDFESLFGSISPRIIEQIDVHTGGFPSKFGDRMSGVVNMQSRVPEDPLHFEAGMSTLTTSALGSGRFADGRGQWLASARRGNLDLLIDAADSDVGEPRYGDLFGKLAYELKAGGVVGAGLLALDDSISLSDGDTSRARADQDDTYFWIYFEQGPSSRFAARYLLTDTRLASQRNGSMDDPDVAIGSLTDVRRFDVTALTASWRYRIDDRQDLQWGLVLSKGSAWYDYSMMRELPFPISAPGLAMPPNNVQTRLSLEDRRSAAFVTVRLQPSDRVVTELGLRWDRQALVGQEELSPRLSVLVDLGDRSTLRASWGLYSQAQDINELQVADGMTTLYPAQRSHHAIVSFEHDLTDSMSFRAEIYRKTVDRVSPRFENMFMRLALLPELLPDRVLLEPLKARARGIELSVEGDFEKWRWWASYARTSASDWLAGAGAVRRSWAEPWSSKGGAIWRGGRWSASVTLTLREGWPISRVRLEDGALAVATYNDQTFEQFRSLDVRAGHTRALRRGSIEYFVELNNALDADNLCCLDYSLDVNDAGAITALDVDTDSWLPAVPTIGFLWQF